MKKDNFDQKIIMFINMLLKDLKEYKTLSTNVLRKLVLKDSNENSYIELINNVKKLQIKIGDNYLKTVIDKTKNIDDEIIIAIENQKK